MKYTINAGEKLNLNLLPGTEEKEILQNIYTLLNTIKGEVPMYRDFGINLPDIRSVPMELAETMLASDIYEIIPKYEPRAKILNIDFYSDSESGKLIPIIEIALKEG